MYRYSTPSTAPLQDTSFPLVPGAGERDTFAIAWNATLRHRIAPSPAPEPARPLTLSAFRTVRRVQLPSHRMTHIREVIPRVMAGLLVQLGSR
jgi:hypothetical protein